MNYHARLIALSAVSCVVTTATPVVAQAPAGPQRQPGPAAWAAGFYELNFGQGLFDMALGVDHKLLLRTYGCFGHGPLVRGTWAQAGDRVTLTDPALVRMFGPTLVIRPSGKAFILVPERCAITLAKGEGFSRVDRLQADFYHDR